MNTRQADTLTRLQIEQSDMLTRLRNEQTDFRRMIQTPRSESCIHEVVAVVGLVLIAIMLLI